MTRTSQLYTRTCPDMSSHTCLTLTLFPLENRTNRKGINKSFVSKRCYMISTLGPLNQVNNIVLQDFFPTQTLLKCPWGRHWTHIVHLCVSVCAIEKSSTWTARQKCCIGACVGDVCMCEWEWTTRLKRCHINAVYLHHNNIIIKFLAKKNQKARQLQKSKCVLTVWGGGGWRRE